MNEIRAAVVAYLRRTGHPATAYAATICSDLDVLRYVVRHWDDLGITITVRPPGAPALAGDTDA